MGRRIRSIFHRTLRISLAEAIGGTTSPFWGIAACSASSIEGGLLSPDTDMMEQKSDASMTEEAERAVFLLTRREEGREASKYDFLPHRGCDCRSTMPLLNIARASMGSLLRAKSRDSRKLAC